MDGQLRREICLPTLTNPPTQYDPQDYLQQQLNNFWANQRQEIEEMTDFKTHNMSRSRIKRIMKNDKDVSMVSAEAPMVFAKACEMFIQELTLKAWANTKDTKRSLILKKSDIISAISKTDEFNFLHGNVISKDHQVVAGIPGNVVAPTENVPHGNMPPHHDVAGPPYS